MHPPSCTLQPPDLLLTLSDGPILEVSFLLPGEDLVLEGTAKLREFEMWVREPERHGLNADEEVGIAEGKLARSIPKQYVVEPTGSTCG
jgi:hypothetical protein